ncbi:MAG: YqgE/AlgH family protein [Flammeovirgaceae bacterium]|nr:YqgE/AlgH family protein [Flammeovirgaceae bacterium]
MDFFKFKNRIEPAKGKLLISEPFLPDPNFERTIVLLCDHNSEGSFGFILNKPSIANIGEVMEDFKKIDSPVFIGGPVQQDTLHFLHQIKDLEKAVEVVPGIYWGGDFDQLFSLFDTGQLAIDEIRFFLGYSGWSEGQLLEEIKEDSWIVSEGVTHDLVFQTKPEDMWQKTLKEMGGRFSIYSNYPVDPRLN